MMKVLVVLLLCVGLAPAAVGQVVMDLPALLGTYDVGFFPPNDAPAGRQVTLTLPAGVVHTEGLRFVVSGELQAGLRICANPYGGPPDSTAYLPGLSLYLWADDPLGHFAATIVPEAGAFAESAGLLVSSWPAGLDPDVLLGSELHAEFFLDVVLPLPCSSGGVDAQLDLTAARLELLAPVPADAPSWGALKALYR